MTEPLMPSKETSIKTTKIGLNGRFKITSTHLQLLSKPYMKSCREYGIVYYVTLYNSIIILLLFLFSKTKVKVPLLVSLNALINYTTDPLNVYPILTSMKSLFL